MKVALPSLIGSILHGGHNGSFMTRMSFPHDGGRIHLAVEGSTGGTTLGLHMAADAIEQGGRVLWAAPKCRMGCVLVNCLNT